MAPFARRPLHADTTGLVPAAAPQPQGSRARPGARRPPDQEVAYFYDLFADYYDPELGRLVVSTLAAHGARVVVPEQRASGIPEMQYGYYLELANSPPPTCAARCRM